MTTQYTHAQLEAWAGLNAKTVIARLAGIETQQMKGDNLAVTLCSYFENPDQEEDENGWTPDAIKGYDEVMAAIREHLAPLAAAPDLARLVLEREKEIARKDAEIGRLREIIAATANRLPEWFEPIETALIRARQEIKQSQKVALLSVNRLDRQAMKETSDDLF